MRIEEINRLLGVDGKTVKAIDVVDKVDQVTLVKTPTFIIADLVMNGGQHE